MLTAAQEQAERAITSARAEAEKTVTAARAEAERTTSEAKKKSESALASAKAQAKKALDEATARATAIHDGAERRLNLLSNRHSETIKRLTEILDGVSGLVAAETSRMSLEDEVEQATAKSIAVGPDSAGGPRPAPADANGPAGPGGLRHRSGADQARGFLPAGIGLVPAAPRPSRRRRQPALSRPTSQPADKRGPARPDIIDDDEHTEGIRIVPGSDN